MTLVVYNRPSLYWLRHLSLKPNISNMSDSFAWSGLEVVRIVRDKEFTDEVAYQVFKRRRFSSQ
jgi:hypothetical protein